MKISAELVIGLVLVIVSAYYWGAIDKAAPLSSIPLFYRYTFRLVPYSDLFITVVGMLVFYRGLRKLRE